MSITVDYKGERIAESAGNALTLLTAGKYMEADVLLSASGGGGESVSEFILFPKNAELVFDGTRSFNLLNDTTIADKSYSTSNQVIKTAEQTGNAWFTTDQKIDGYVYFACISSRVEPVYNVTPTAGFFKRKIAKRYAVAFKIRNGYGYDDIGIGNIYYYPSIESNLSISYGDNVAGNSNYGIQFYAPVIANASGKLVLYDSNAFNFRGNTLYLSQQAFESMDFANTNIIETAKIYRVPEAEFNPLILTSHSVI